MMSKSAVMAHLAGKTNLSKRQIVEIFDERLALASKEAKNGFVRPGFGKLVLANRKARLGRNPPTGEPIKIPASRGCKFRLATHEQDAVPGKEDGQTGVAAEGPGPAACLPSDRAPRGAVSRL